MWRRISRYVRDHQDRVIGLASLTAGIVSIGISLFVGVILKQPEPNFIIARDVIVVFGLVLSNMFLAVLLAQRHVRIVELQQIFVDQCRFFHDAVRNYKDDMFKEYFNGSAGNGLTREEKAVFEGICVNITDAVRESLQHYLKAHWRDIGNDIAVSVKVIVPSEQVVQGFNMSDEQKKRIMAKKRWVVTVYRDHYSRNHHRDRETNEKAYDIEGNTAFNNIVNHGHPFFRCNDLSVLDRSRAYLNENPEWARNYNATLVVPIRYLNEYQKVNKCYGFLAIDSLNKIKSEDLFEGDGCVYILEHAADLLATHFLSLEMNRSSQLPMQIAPSQTLVSIAPPHL